MLTFQHINRVISILFFVCYFYQFVYIAVSFYAKKVTFETDKKHRFAVLIAARNEEKVIGNLIDSLNAQDYPTDLFDIYVVADNCNDRTSEIARSKGATVWSRNNKKHIGKGYALAFLLERIRMIEDKAYDGYFVFDADNLVDPRFISEMNNIYAQGYQVITCYRNSKNYEDNWITAGYGLWFLREAKYLNNARMCLGNSCAVSGTGFFFSQDVISDSNGWNYYTLTEDIEFSIYNVIHDTPIGYCEKAIIYDEQPNSFSQSWRQRLRWSKGYLQVLKKHGISLLKGVVQGKFSCYDMLMNILPAQILTISMLIEDLIMLTLCCSRGDPIGPVMYEILKTVAGMYCTLFIVGSITTATEWKNINCNPILKIMYMVTFPVFMFTYFPIYVASLFTNVKWEPISHTKDISLKQLQHR